MFQKSSIIVSISKTICYAVFVKGLSITCRVSVKTDKEPHFLKSRPREIRPDISQGRICFVTGNLRPDVSGYSGIPCASHLRHARQSLNLGLYNKCGCFKQGFWCFFAYMLIWLYICFAYDGFAGNSFFSFGNKNIYFSGNDNIQA